MAGGLMFGLTLVLGLGRAAMGDDRGVWAPLVLMTPAGLLGIRQIDEAQRGCQRGHHLGQPRRHERRPAVCGPAGARDRRAVRAAPRNTPSGGFRTLPDLSSPAGC